MPPLDHYIWYEKYRPKHLDDMILPPEYKTRFRAYLEDKSIPHLLFVGPPGSGKTTMALILTSGLDTQTLALNASSTDRGIDTIKGKVKQFASSQSFQGRLKVVFLDEADGLTRDAQEALRNTIEQYASSCRFILTANYIDKITPPLKSRCTIFTFDTIAQEELKNDLVWILESEQFGYHTGELEKLIDRYYPDVRTIINNLQAGCNTNGRMFLLENIGTVVDINLADLDAALRNGKIADARKLWAGTSDFVWLYRWLFDEWVATQFLDETRTAAALIVAQSLYQDAIVMDREINFTACCLELMQERHIPVKWR